MTKRIYIILICLFVLTKLIIVSHMKVTAIGHGSHDDRLFLELASNLVRTGWFGDYNRMVLSKGWGYPVFIAANFLIGLPLLFGQQIFYILAALTLTYTFSLLEVNRAWRLVMFALILFNPATFFGESTRVLRMGIYPALTVFVLAGAIGCLAIRHRSWRALYGWACVLGFFFCWFWITREEGIWFVPSVLLMLAAAAITIFRNRVNRKDLIIRWAGLVLPWALCGLILTGICTVNKIKYGIFTTNEFKTVPFLSAYGALCRVKHPTWQPHLPVPKDVRAMIYQTSPAFKELEPLMENPHFWETGCSIYPNTCGDIAGGWFMWALREAVDRKGYYINGRKAMGYYRRLADEINQACEDGRLVCGPERASMMPPMHPEYWRQLPANAYMAARMLVGFIRMPMTPLPSMGTPKQLNYFQDMTQSLIYPISDKNIFSQVSVRGWAFQEDTPTFPEMRLTTDGREIREYAIDHWPTPYLVDQLGNENARFSGFEIEGICPEPCTLRIYRDGSLLADVALQQNRRYQMDGVRWDLERVGKDKTANEQFGPQRLKRQTRLAESKGRLLTSIAIFYQRVVPVWFFLALAAYCIGLVRIFRRRISSLFIINTALLGALAARILILAVIDTTSFPALNWVYMSPAAPLLLIFLVTTIVDLRFQHSPKMPAKA